MYKLRTMFLRQNHVVKSLMKLVPDVCGMFTLTMLNQDIIFLHTG